MSWYDKLLETAKDVYPHRSWWGQLCQQSGNQLYGSCTLDYLTKEV